MHNQVCEINKKVRRYMSFRGGMQEIQVSRVVSLFRLSLAHSFVENLFLISMSTRACSFNHIYVFVYHWKIG